MAAKIFWLASYPRSGNTWLRVLIANALYGQIVSAEQVASLVPNVHNGITGNHLMQRGAVVLKTHWPYDDDIPLKGETVGALYLLRNPIDVMASALRHRFMIDFIHAKPPAPPALERMARRWVKLYLANRGAPHWLKSGFGRWDDHVRSWTQDCRTIPVHPVRYEDLRARTQQSLDAICRFLKAPMTPASLAAAVENSSMARMRQFEQQEIASGTPHLFRGSGAPGALPDLRFNDSADSDTGRALALTEDEIAAARELFADTMARFGYD
jgi:hypothetical protein